MDNITDAICSEIALQKDYLGVQVLDTVYFGGGTPSLMREENFDKIVGSLHTYFTLAPSCEVTVEANPDDLSRQKLNMYKGLGVNRLSIGIQSFSDSVLLFLNRSHDSKTALKGIERARSLGFDNLSFDLMYAIPHQDHATWANNIETALSFQPEHLSAYSLTIEQKTVFGHWLSKGKIVPFSESGGAAQFELLAAILEKAGYVHYEVSNFCRPGFYAVHNSNYWKQKHYLGIGPSAHSFNGDIRQFNINNNSLYIDALRRGKIPCKKEVLSRDNRINEYIFTSLRTIWGCDFTKLKNEYGIDMERLHKRYLHNLVVMRLAFMRENCLLLTLKGKLLADKITSDLFV